MAIVTMRQLLESGVHFGHQTRRWNPKMKRFILTERNGIYVIDLQQTVEGINTAYDFVKEIVARGGSILFVGTKKQAQAAVAEQAQRVGMPYVSQRWLGGMLTNFSTVRARLDRMKELEQIDFDDVAGSGRTKKELLMMRREKDKLVKTLGGIRDMSRLPAAVWVVDTKKEHLAISEARKLNIPVVAILDTNCDPDEVTYGVPGNDDAIRAVSLLTRVIADAAAEGLVARSGKDIKIIFTGLRPNEKMHEVLFSDDEDRTPTTHEMISRVNVPALDPELLETVDGSDPESLTTLTHQRDAEAAREKSRQEASAGLDGIELERPES